MIHDKRMLESIEPFIAGHLKRINHRMSFLMNGSAKIALTFMMRTPSFILRH